MLKMILKLSFLLFVFTFTGNLPLLGINSSEPADTLLFSQHETLELTIRTDINYLISNRDRHMEYIDGEISFENHASELNKIKSEIKVRGNYRLKAETCDFPPLRLKFKNKEIANSIFENNKKLKLVTHCREDNSEMLNSVYREYLAYRLYNIISPNSLNVRLTRVTYIDINTGNTIKQIGFLIEDDETLSKRLSCENLAALNLSMEQLEREEMIRMAMFEYLIGNKDWSVPKLHNVVLLREGTHTPPFAVPFDFDMSSFSNPPYRQQIIGEEEEEMIYQGFRVDCDQLQNSIQHYQDKKEELLNLILDFPYLSVTCKQLCLQQIEDFYSKLDRKSSIRRTFVSKVR